MGGGGRTKGRKERGEREIKFLDAAMPELVLIYSGLW